MQACKQEITRYHIFRYISLFLDSAMSKRAFDVQDVIDFVHDGNDSKISDFSEDNDSGDEFIIGVGDNVIDDSSSSEDEDCDDDVPLANLQSSRAEPGEPKSHTYRWRKADVPKQDENFSGTFSDRPSELLTPIPYFFLFIDVVVEHTNLYSVQQTLKSVDTNADEMKAFIGMQMIMSIVKMPSIRHYW